MYLSRDYVEAHLGGRGYLPAVKAAILGVPLPLCSCSVLPVAASLRKHGAGKGSTVAFLLSTPQTGVDSILVTYSLLGPVFAVVRPIAAFLSGVLGGWLTNILEGRGTGAEETLPSCSESCCTGRDRRGRLKRAMRHGFVTLPADLARPMLIGIALAGLISALVPVDFFSRWVGSGLAAMFVMMLLGIPLYVCATASVPIAAAFIAKGVSPGAALVFLMTGPATNAAAISTIWRILGGRTAVTYLGTVAATALASGFLLDLFLQGGGRDFMQAAHHELPAWVGTLSALVLLAVLGFALAAPLRARVAKRCCSEEETHE